MRMGLSGVAARPHPLFGPGGHILGMRRVVRPIMVGVLSLACAGFLILWGRSYFVSDMLERHRRGDLHGQAGAGAGAGARAYDEIHGSLSSRGVIGFGYVRIDHPPVAGFQEGWMHEAGPAPRPWPMRVDVLGFGYWNLK